MFSYLLQSSGKTASGAKYACQQPVSDELFIIHEDTEAIFSDVFLKAEFLKRHEYHMAEAAKQPVSLQKMELVHGEWDDEFGFLSDRSFPVKI